MAGWATTTPSATIPAPSCTDHDRSFACTEPVPAVYGHHGRDGEPAEHHDFTPNTACVDFSAAKGGPLVAYRWRGESVIDPARHLDFPTPSVAVPA